ncbi:MAG: hypothetical protein LBK82_03985 [Planctomycetaceae bacterium]|jgi:hypothetical protein|nr:hypothetical protein [Planctomycetaceae bacterium]
MSDFISKTNGLPDQLPSDNCVLSDQILTFDASNRNGIRIRVFFSVGIFWAVISVVALILLFTIPSFLSPFILFLIIFLIFSYMFLTFLFCEWRIAGQMILDSDTIILNGYGWLKKLQYKSITKIYHSSVFSPNLPPNPNSLLILLGRNSRVIGYIPIKTANYDLLETELLRRIKNITGKQVYNWEEELSEKRRNRKQRRRRMTLGYCTMMIAICSNAVMVYWNNSNYFTKSNDIAIEAEIVHQRPFDKEGRFYLLEYVFTVDGKEYTNTNRLQKREWTNLKGRKTVTARYLPDDPNENYLEQGENDRYKDKNKIRFSFRLFLFELLGMMFLFIFCGGGLGYEWVTYNGVTYLLKPGQILEDRLDELIQHSNQCSDKQIPL